MHISGVLSRITTGIAFVWGLITPLIATHKNLQILHTLHGLRPFLSRFHAHDPHDTAKEVPRSRWGPPCFRLLPQGSGVEALNPKPDLKPQTLNLAP